MVGEEILGVAAASKAVTEAVKAAAPADDGSSTALVAEAVKTKQFQDAAIVRAKREVVKQQVLLKIVQPIGMMVGISADYFKTDFDADLAEKLSEVPEEYIATPKPSVAVPAIEQLALTLHEPNLKDMFLELLAKASDSRTHEVDNHPSFVHIVSQLGNLEASVLKMFLRSRSIQAIAELHMVETAAGAYHVRSGTLWGGIGDEDNLVRIENFPIFVDNWVRLRLVEVDWANSVTRETAYDWVERTPEYLALAVEADSIGQRVDFAKGVMRVTEFGRRFAVAVGAQPPTI